MAEKKYDYGVDYFSDPNAATAADSPLVFVGRGWLLKSRNIDDLKDLDIKGKTVVMYYSGLPKEFLEDRDAGKLGQYGKDWLDSRTYVTQKGAVGIIRIASLTIQENWEFERPARENADDVGTIGYER